MPARCVCLKLQLLARGVGATDYQSGGIRGGGKETEKLILAPVSVLHSHTTSRQMTATAPHEEHTTHPTKNCRWPATGQLFLAMSAFISRARSTCPIHAVHRSAITSGGYKSMYTNWRQPPPQVRM